MLNKKNENLSGDNIYYVFVSLNELDQPEYHIVPSKVVSKTIKDNHHDWLNSPGKKGQSHNDNSMREFKDEDNKYLDKWDLLK